MSRLIDADKLKKTICGSCELPSEHLCSTEGDVKGCLAEIINNAPTVDAVEVVRCRECKHNDVFRLGMLLCNNSHSKCFMRNIDRDDFCKYGERRTDEKET